MPTWSFPTAPPRFRTRLSAFCWRSRFTGPSRFSRDTPIIAPELHIRAAGSGRYSRAGAALFALALFVPAQVFAQSSPPTAKELEKAEREKELEILRSDLEQRKA